MKNISEKVYFRVEEKLYQEFKMFHFRFLEKTEFFEVEDIKNFFILLIQEWEEQLHQMGKWEKAEEVVIEAVNRKGKRVSKLPYEGETTRITFHFKPQVKEKWDSIIYFLMKEENFINSKEYTNGYFLPRLYELAQKNEVYLVDKYKKELHTSYLLKQKDHVMIKFINKDTIKTIAGGISRIEETPKGMVIYIDRTMI